MRKLLAIFLLSLLLFNTTGYYLSFIISQFSAKTEAWLQIQHHNGEAFVKLKFPLKQGAIVAEGLRFTDADECVYQDRLYDIASRTDSAGYSILTCFCDNKETEAVADLSKEIESHHEPPGGNHKQLLLKDLFKDFITGNNVLRVTEPPASVGVHFYSHCTAFKSGHLGVITPPPDFFIA